MSFTPPASSMPGLASIPLLIPAFAWLLGLACVRMDALPWMFCVWLATLALIALVLRIFRPFFFPFLLGLAWGLAAMVWDACQVQVDASWLEDVQAVQAEILELAHANAYTRLRLQNVVRDDKQRLHGYADVYVRAHSRTNLSAGQRIALQVKFKLPRNKQNPHAFDYVGYCFDRHIALLGSVRGDVQVLRDSSYGLEQVRHNIRMAMAPLPAEVSGVLLALLLADKSQLQPHIYEAFSASGTAHLLAISGLHIGMVIAAGFALAWWLLTRSERVIVRMPVRALAMGFGLLLAILYASLASWPLPTVRAVLMAAGAMFAWQCRQHTHPLQTMLLVMCVILLVQPSAVVALSFWLSFLSVAALLLWAGGFSQRDSSMRGVLPRIALAGKGLLWVSVLAFLVTLPVVVDAFGRLPSYSLIANMLLVPIYSLYILPLALIASLFAAFGALDWASYLLQWAGHAVVFCNTYTLWLQDLPWGNHWLSTPPLWLHVLYGLVVCAGLALFAYGQKQAGVAMVLAMLGLYVAYADGEGEPPSATELYVWDVGQGAASGLRFANGVTWVIDAPGSWDARFNGGTIVADALRHMGVTKLDGLVLTHAQSDHMGGAMRLLQQLNTVRVMYLADVPSNRAHAGIQALIAGIMTSGGRVHWLAQGDVLAVADGVSIHVLWPPRGFAPNNENDASLVLSVRLGETFKILLPGDMERRVEHQLATLGLLEQHDVLLIPHHGSLTSSSHDFVVAMHAQIAIAQTGYGNHFGFPKMEVVQRYADVGSEVWDSSAGMIRMVFDKDMRIEQYHAPTEKRQNVVQWMQACCE